MVANGAVVDHTWRLATSAGRVTWAMMETVSDGLAKAPEWAGTLRASLEDAGFGVREERRFDQPFGLYAVLLARHDMAVQIASDRAIRGGPMWRIDLMRAEDIGSFPAQYDSPAALRAALEGRQGGGRGWDTAETASWVVGHIDEIASALTGRRRRHRYMSSRVLSGRGISPPLGGNGPIRPLLETLGGRVTRVVVRVAD